VSNQNFGEDLMTSLISFNDPIIPESPSPPPPPVILVPENIDYTSLFELNIRSVPLTSSILF
jgi:hypothetical protein